MIMDGFEPALALAFLQHDGQAAEGDRHADDAEPVGLRHKAQDLAFCAGSPRVSSVTSAMPTGRLRKKHQRQDDLFGEPAADHGTEQRAEQHDEAEDGHADRHLPRRQPGAHDGLRRRNQRAAEEALADAAEDHRGRPWLSPHSIEKSAKAIVVVSSRRRRPSTRVSHAVSGIMTTSATR